MSQYLRPISRPKRLETPLGGAALVFGIGVLAALFCLISLGEFTYDAGTAAFTGLAAALCLPSGIFLFVQRILERKRWEPFEFHFPAGGISLGSETDVTIIRKSRKPIPDVAELRFEALLLCQERVTYRSGNNQRTKSKTAFSQTIEVIGSVANNTFTGTAKLCVPVDQGGPTIDLNHNKIRWTLTIRPKGLTNIRAAVNKGLWIDVHVLPVLHKSQRRLVDGPAPPMR